MLTISQTGNYLNIENSAGESTAYSLDNIEQIGMSGNKITIFLVDGRIKVIDYDEVSSPSTANIGELYTTLLAYSHTDVFSIKKTIGIHLYSDTDFSFASAANHTAQNINLGAIVPAMCRVVGIEIVCTEAYVNSAGASDITFRAGNASAGEQFIASLSCDDLNEVVGIVDATKPAAVKMDWASATSIWIGGDPDQNWSTSTYGRWTVYISYIDYTNV